MKREVSPHIECLFPWMGSGLARETNQVRCLLLSRRPELRHVVTGGSPVIDAVPYLDETFPLGDGAGWAKQPIEGSATKIARLMSA